ncbi:MAG TPA: Yip1 family protein [Ktedonobacteraceae bacterium]|jgi:Yip1-like protein|nr:Yip1 family protein [Ktedonobacteraceae bacterium]
MSQQESTITTSATPFSLGEALFGFYARSMFVFLRPSPASFAEETGNANWGVVWIQIFIMTLVMGLFTFLWGRLSLFTPASTPTTPLSIITALILTLAVPVMFFVIGGITLFIATSLDGKGSFLAQAYTTLLIGMPLFLLSMIVIVISLHLPTLGVILGLFDFLLLLYGVVLQVLATMAVHRLGAGKATIVVLSQTIAIIALVLIIAFVFIMASNNNDSSSTASSNGSSTATQNNDGGSQQTDTNTGGLEQTGDLGDILVYSAYPRGYVQSGPSTQAPNIPLSEAICPSCQYTEWVEQPRINNQLPCINCGTQMTPSGNNYHGAPPTGYAEVQCPRCQYHEWTAQHRLAAGITCINCNVKMQPTGNRW